MAYATTAQVKTYLGITGSGDDTLIGDLIDRAQKTIETHTHRVFEAGSDTTRTFDAVRDVDGDTLYIDEDLCAITTVTNGDSDSTVITSSQYTTEPRNTTPYYALVIKSDANVLWEYNAAHEDAISIEGRWAYSTTAPNDIIHATIRLAAWYYKQKDAVFEKSANPMLGVVTVPAMIPPDVKMILMPYVKVWR